MKDEGLLRLEGLEGYKFKIISIITKHKPYKLKAISIIIIHKPYKLKIFLLLLNINHIN